MESSPVPPLCTTSTSVAPNLNTSLPLPEVLGPSPMQMHINPAVSTLSTNEVMLPMELLSTVLPSTNSTTLQLSAVETTELIGTAKFCFPTTELDISIPELHMTPTSMHPLPTTPLSPTEQEGTTSTTSGSATTALHTSMPELPVTLTSMHSLPTTSLSPAQAEREMAISPTCNSGAGHSAGPINNHGEILHKYTKLCVIAITFLDPYSISGNRIISLSLLGTYLQEITNHAAVCGHGLEFLGESKRIGLCSILVSRCFKCRQYFKMYTAEYIKLGEKGHYSTNMGAVLGQISTGGGGHHLQEQLCSMNIPSLSPHSFVRIERSLGTAFEDIVTHELLSAGIQEREHAITTKTFFEDIPACTVVVDAGWSKRCHKHSYNANTGVGVIFGAHSKKLLYIGIHNKYCSTCSIVHRSSSTIPVHQCYKNWSQSSCAMESDIIVGGFKSSERMHGLRYMWMIGDGDSSVYSSVSIGVPYGRFVQKVECTNHAIKCYRSALEKLVKEHSTFAGRKGLGAGKIRHLCKGMKCAILHHSKTGDSAALRKDLRNCPKHCFNDHRQCSASFCKNAGEGNGGKCI